MVWTPSDISRLKKGVEDGLSSIELHKQLFQDRSLRSVQLKLNRLGLKSGTPKSNATGKPIPTGESVEDRITNEGDRIVVLKRTHIHSIEGFREVYKFDDKEWRIDDFTFNQWEVGAVVDGVIVVSPLYQVKAKLKPNNVISNVWVEVQALIEDVKRQMPPAPIHVYPASFRRPCALEISIPDLHMGKYAEAAETGADYTLDIAERLFHNAVQHHLRCATPHEVEKIVFVAGNDILNTDSSHNQTHKGTPQHPHKRHTTAFRRTRIMLTDSIRACAAIAPVEVLMVPGNHDYDCVYYLGDSLECAFHFDTRVTIVNHANPRKIWEYGQNLILFTHGDEEKKADLPLLLAVENKEVWGRTTYREVHCAHLHQVALLEKLGVRVRTLPSLSAAEHWHHGKGFVGNLRVSESYIWDKARGFKTMNVYVPEDDDLLL